MIVAFDIGGTEIKSGLYDASDNGTVCLHQHQPIPHHDRQFTTLAATLQSIVRTYRQEYPVTSAAVSTAGIVSGGILLRYGGISGYQNISWSSVLDLPTYVVNDGNASAWSEYQAQPTPYHLHGVIGTGFGGGIVDAGVLTPGLQDHYLTHCQPRESRAPHCTCGITCCADGKVSAYSIWRRYNEHRPTDTFRHVVQYAQDGDPVALEAFADAGRWLAIAIEDILRSYPVTRLTIGGGIIDADESIPSQPYWTAVTVNLPDQALVHQAVHRNQGGMLGAVLLSQTAACATPILVAH